MISKFDVTIQSDELTAADLYDAQSEWEAEQYEAEEPLPTFDPHRDFYAEMDDEAYEWTEEAIAWEEGMHPDNLYDGEPEMILEDDLYMIIEDDPYDGEMWEDTYDDHPADMYVWDCDLHNEF